MLTFASICPHPPIIVPGIGSPGDLEIVKKTTEAMEKLAKDFSKARPETAVLVSPHGPVEFNQMTVNKTFPLRGDFRMFGNPTSFEFKNDLDLIKEMEDACQKEKIPLGFIKEFPLDHGALVPLSYLSKDYSDFKLVHLAFSYLSLETHFNFGKAIGNVIKKSDKKIAFIASGDLSHRLTLEAPAGYSPRGKEFDEKLIGLIKGKDIEGILNLDPVLIEEAGECGLRSIIILFGVLDGSDFEPEILSYEGPFGVGYLVANFKFKGLDR
jgi:aromatic ring-opening dioxygenase LigB subunit